MFLYFIIWRNFNVSTINQYHYIDSLIQYIYRIKNGNLAVRYSPALKLWRMYGHCQSREPTSKTQRMTSEVPHQPATWWNLIRYLDNMWNKIVAIIIKILVQSSELIIKFFHCNYLINIHFLCIILSLHTFKSYIAVPVLNSLTQWLTKTAIMNVTGV